MDIVVDRLTMNFKDGERSVLVFKDLSFQISSGASVAIVGQSGVGKTTLLYLLGALETPVSGDIILGSKSLSELSQEGDNLSSFRGRSIGFVFQFHQLLPEFDAIENVLMPLIIQGVPVADARARAISLLKRVGLGHRLEHRPGALSGGEQQRVAIARALVVRPGLILADEPTGNLDYKTSLEIRELLRELQTEFKCTLVVVTHSLDLARSMDRVLEMTPEGMTERQ